MLIDAFLAYWPVWLLGAELLLLYVAYRTLFADIVVRKWEEKVTRDDGAWLVDILSPVIDTTVNEILTETPHVVLNALKHELLSSQGALTKAANAKSDDPVIGGLQMIEGLLKDTGLKNPSISMIMKVARSLGGLSESVPQGQNSNVTELKIGSDLFKN